MVASESAPKSTSHWLLAIDSSTEQAGVALFDGEQCAELSCHVGRNQTVALLAEIDHLLGRAGVDVSDLAAVAVATGPGTFNGLRVAMSVAKGLVLGLGVSLIGVSTLDAAALPYAVSNRPTIVTVAAGRGRLVWAVYGPSPDGRARTSAEPRNGTPAELAKQAAGFGGVVVTGELTPAQEEIVRTVPGVVLPPRPIRVRRPGAVAALAWDRFVAGDTDDPITLEPTYLHGTSRQPSAVSRPR